MSEEITAAAVRILGTEEEMLPALCTAAEAGLRARLRRDVDPEKECRECFVMAAALVAASTLLSAQAQGVTDFDAGQVSLRLKDPGDSMVRGALYMLTPWMEPDTCFVGVRACSGASRPSSGATAAACRRCSRTGRRSCGPSCSP